MFTKRDVFLTCAGIGLMLASTKVMAQEDTSSPLDTLARSVQNIQEDLTILKRLKFSGYILSQYQYADSAGAPYVGGGDFSNGSSKYYSRFMIREGRIKLNYDYNNVQLVMSLEMNERNPLALRETYLKITDPWLKMFSLAAGLQPEQVGFELNYSSGVRETPERVRYNQTLFPTERDMGVFGTVVFPKASPLYGIRIDASVVNGANGVTPEFDNHKDFTGRLQYSRTTKNEKVSYAIAASLYDGGYRLGNVKDYNFGILPDGDKGFQFATDTANYNRVGKRIYESADAQLTFDWKAGITTLRAEYIQGEQPGISPNSTSPRGPATAAIYHRNFNGGYFYFIQNIGQSKFQAVFKYDWYDPNTKIAGTDIGKAGTNTQNIGDIRFDTYGFGINYRLNAFVKMSAYYDLVKNEATAVHNYEKDIKDNVTTLRLTFRF